MLQAYIVYISLVIIMTFLARKNVVINTMGHYQISCSVSLSILIFSVIIGCRYMVGVDYAGYLSIYESAPDSYQVEGLEFFFRHLINFLAGSQLHFSYFFVISAFLQIFFFYKSFSEDIKCLLPWAIMTFLMTEIGPLENGIRHFVALMIFFYSLRYIKEKRLFYYLCTIIFAGLFHASALLCIPLYWILGHNLFKNIGIQFILLCISVLLSSYFVSVVENFTSLLILLGYDGYLTMLEEEGSSGIGFYVTWGLNVLIILFFPKLYAAYKDKGFIIYWNLFYIGLLLKPMTDFIQVLSRINWYFYKFRFLILAFLLHYLYTRRHINSSYYFLYCFFLGWVIIFFLYEIYAGANMMSPFYFFWQSDVYVPVD